MNVSSLSTSSLIQYQHLHSTNNRGEKERSKGVGIFFSSEGYNLYFIIVQKVIGYFSHNDSVKDSNNALKLLVLSTATSTALLLQHQLQATSPKPVPSHPEFAITLLSNMRAQCFTWNARRGDMESQGRQGAGAHHLHLSPSYSKHRLSLLLVQPHCGALSCESTFNHSEAKREKSGKSSFKL